MELDVGPDKTSEYEKQIKEMVNKQTTRTLTLKKQFGQHKEFVTVDTEIVIPESFKGFHTLPELKSAQITQQELNAFKLAGLTDEEIELYLQHEETTDVSSTKPSNVQVEPSILKLKLEEIKLKLEAFTKNSYNNVSVPKDPFFYVAQLSQKIDNSLKRKRKKVGKTRKQELIVELNDKELNDDASDGIDLKSIDPSLLQVAVPIEESVIIENRLSVEEIRQLERFKGYVPGNPSSILYIKNLHPKIHVRELLALFSRFDTSEEFVQYRILTGRMKGQAFVTFKDKHLAKRAFNLANGYKLRGRPMIIEYSRRTQKEAKI